MNTPTHDKCRGIVKHLQLPQLGFQSYEPAFPQQPNHAYSQYRQAVERPSP